MKKVLAIILSLAVAITLCFLAFVYFSSNTDDVADLGATMFELTPKSVHRVTDDISVSILSDPCYPASGEISIVIENNSDSVVIYGLDWFIERYKDGTWMRIGLKEIHSFPALGYYLNKREAKTIIIRTSILEEPLVEDIYRLTGCTLTVVHKDGNDEMESIYPPYQLDFIISKKAT